MYHADLQTALPRAQVARTTAGIAQRRLLSDQARKLIDGVSGKLRFTLLSKSATNPRRFRRTHWSCS